MFRMVAVAAGLVVAPLAAQAEVVRHPIPDSDFPILQAVEIPGDATVVHLSGAGPADDASAGDTEAQTVSTFESIADQLAALDLAMGDVVKMTVFLVTPEGAETADFAGFMAGYSQFFGTEAQPELPTRSTVIVEALAVPEWLVEIEVTAVRPD